MLGPIKTRKEIFKSLTNTKIELNINKLSILKNIDNNFVNKKSLLNKTINKKVNFNLNIQDQKIIKNKKIVLKAKAFFYQDFKIKI